MNTLNASTVTVSDLQTLKTVYARGVSKIREGDTWIEFQSMTELRIAIADLENELKGGKPLGTRFVSTSSGY